MESLRAESAGIDFNHSDEDGYSLKEDHWRYCFLAGQLADGLILHT
jgi:hypothetical protein